MSAQPMAKDLDRNPRTFEEARVMVKYVESLFNPWNVDALAQGFTEDCVIRFCDIPEYRGRDKVRKMFEARSKRQKDYRLVKTLKSLMNDTICNTWEGQWIDLETGKEMAGYGCEVWKLRDGKIAEWDGAFNAWEKGKKGPMAVLLTGDAA